MDCQGHYFDDTDRALPLEGMTRIMHLEAMWINEGEMEIKAADKPIKIYNRYEIVPFREGRHITTWESLNPDLGILQGRFVIVGDTIISTCRSENGDYAGTEIMLNVSDMHYKNRGVLFKGNDKLSSWSVDLRKT
ncbi:MAG TPA: hypothetical protein VEF33_13065 [Syntrophales bacterium]|nr:hypothetical protein [Syntrophales bacterium]